MLILFTLFQRGKAMSKIMYKNQEHTIMYKDSKSKIMYKDVAYQDEDEPQHDYLYNWDFTKSRIDEIQGVEATGGNLQSDGVHITSISGAHCVNFNQGYNKNYVYEIDIYSMNRGFSSANGRLLMVSQTQGLVYRSSTSHWGMYLNYKWRDSEVSSEIDLSNAHAFIGKTIKILCDSEDKVCLYADDKLFFKMPYVQPNPKSTTLMLGSDGTDYYYEFVVSGVRIYEND